MVNTERTLCSSDFASNFVEGLQELWRHGKCCDSEIEVGSRVLKFHRIVLAVASDAFLETNNSLPTDRLVIQLPVDTDIQAVDAVLQYLYGSDLTVTSTCVHTVLKLANLFKIQSVIKFCEEFVQQSEGCANKSKRNVATRGRLKRSLGDTNESLEKKTLSSGFKFPAPSQGSGRGRGSRGIRSVRGLGVVRGQSAIRGRGSPRGRGAVTSDKGSGINAVKIRGQSRGRSRGRTRIRGRGRGAASNLVKLEHESKHSDIDNDFVDDNGSFSDDSGEDSKNADSDYDESIDSKTSLSKPLRGSKYRSLSNSARSCTRTLLSNTECAGTSSMKSTGKLSSLRGRKRGRGVRRPTRGRPQLNNTLLNVLGKQSIKPYSTGNTSRYQKEIKEYLRKQRDIQKQKRYRDKMKDNPEWRRKEAERVKRRYIPRSKLNAKELLLSRKKNKEYSRRWRMQKKLQQLQTPLEHTHVEMVKDVEDVEGFSGGISVPHIRDSHLGGVNILNAVNNPENMEEIANLKTTIKQEVDDSVLDSNESFVVNEMEPASIVENIDGSNISITYHVTENTENCVDIPNTSVGNTCSDVENDVENQAPLEKIENESTALLKIHASAGVNDMNEQLNSTDQSVMMEEHSPPDINVPTSIQMIEHGNLS